MLYVAEARLDTNEVVLCPELKLQNQVYHFNPNFAILHKFIEFM